MSDGIPEDVLERLRLELHDVWLRELDAMIDRAGFGVRPSDRDLRELADVEVRLNVLGSAIERRKDRER